MTSKPKRSHSGSADSHVSKPIFNRDEANEAISDSRVSHFGSAYFLEPEEVLEIPGLCQPDPDATGCVDLAGEIAGDGERQSVGVYLNGGGLLLTFAAPGGGKSSQIATQLLRPRGDSAIVMDFKGELYSRCAKYLSKHVRVVQHGLFFQRGEEFNPIKLIPRPKPGSSPNSVEALRARTDLFNLARDAIEPTLAQSFWVNAERSIFYTLAGYVHDSPLARDSASAKADPWRVQTRTMGEVYRLLNLVGEDRKRLFSQGLAKSRYAFVREGAKKWEALAAARDTYAAVHSDLLDQLEPWSHPVIARSSKECSYSFDELREKPTVVFLRVPPAEIRYCKAWLRSYFGSAIRNLMRNTKGCGVTIYADEAAMLGTMDTFDEVVYALRGYRIRLNMYLQSVGQLKSAYPRTNETWLSSAFAKVFFHVNDIDTAEWVSRTVGDTTVSVPSFLASEADSKNKQDSTARTEGTNEFSSRSASKSKTFARNVRHWLALPFTDGIKSGQPEGSRAKQDTQTEGSGSGRSSQTTITHTEGTGSTATTGTNFTYAQRRLIDPAEVMKLPDGVQIIQTVHGPIYAGMVRYFTVDELLKRAGGAKANELTSPSYSVNDE